MPDIKLLASAAVGVAILVVLAGALDWVLAHALIFIVLGVAGIAAVLIVRHHNLKRHRA
jgi:hypothetical protein